MAGVINPPVQRNRPRATVVAAQWRAIVARDARAAGRFVYAVRTTGVFCRPGCPSRLPRRDNVEVFASSSAARGAGYRPCKRCWPEAGESPSPGMIAEACRALERSADVPDLAQLAAAAGLSKFHFQRLFKRMIGLTPKAYAAARRGDRLRRTLSRGQSVARAAYEAGYQSSSRLYASSLRVLGMSPASYRHGGFGATIGHAVRPCWLGWLLVAATERGICAILLGDDRDALFAELSQRFPQATLVGPDRRLERLVARVVKLVSQPARADDLPLDLCGTAFQYRVWHELSQIPAGSTATYSELARRLGAPSSVRAVASACAANPLAVAIPCHRAVRSDGGLAGYRWGLDRKRALLEREAQSTSKVRK